LKFFIGIRLTDNGAEQGQQKCKNLLTLVVTSEVTSDVTRLSAAPGRP